jgi:excisionase family DNA binding protein
MLHKSESVDVLTKINVSAASNSVMVCPTGIYEPIVSAFEQLLKDVPVTACPALAGDLERLRNAGMGTIMAERIATHETDDDLLTIPQVARRLKVSPYRAYELARQGLLKTIRLGRSVRVRPSAVAEYLARQGA